MIRFITYAVPLLWLLLALFGFAMEMLDLEPRSGAVIRWALFDPPRVPATVVLGVWLMEACGLLALFLLAQGRCGAWWLDGLVAGWLAWIFRGPLLVLTVVVAARQPQGPWWDLALGWWVLYSVCGLSLAWLARRSEIGMEPAPAVPLSPAPVISSAALSSDHTATAPDISETEPTEESEPVDESENQALADPSDPDPSDPDPSDREDPSDHSVPQLPPVAAGAPIPEVDTESVEPVVSEEPADSGARGELDPNQDSEVDPADPGR